MLQRSYTTQSGLISITIQIGYHILWNLLQNVIAFHLTWRKELIYLRTCDVASKDSAFRERRNMCDCTY